MFGPWMDFRAVFQVLINVRLRPFVTFIFLTKFPDGLKECDDLFRANCWVGVTVTGGEDSWRIRKLLELNLPKGVKRFASFEPLLSDPGECLARQVLDWQIIGPQTNPLVQPKKEWVDKLVVSGVPTFMKRKLDYELHLKQWPEGRDDP
jgi:protein gp37